MKRIGSLILVSLFAVAMLSFSGCRKYEQIRITSADVKSVGMNGLRSINVDLLIGVDNPAGKVVIKHAEGTVKHFGKVIGSVSLAPLEIMPRSQAEYPVKASVELAQGMNLMEVMQLASPKKLNECTLDVSVSGTVAGVAVKKKYNDIPLKQLLESNNHEKI